METRAILIEIFMLCWNLQSAPKHHNDQKQRGWLQKKNITFPEENKLFAGNFVLIWMKQTLIWFNLEKKMELEMDCLTSKRLWQKVCS